MISNIVDMLICNFMSNVSPWISQLKKHRPVVTISENVSTDIAVVGAGIAGVTTAYFTLKHTNHTVLLIEGSKVAHGATGHNAGQIVSYFERQISELVKEFGLELTAQAQHAIDSGWGLLENIYADTKIVTPFSQFRGFAGCQDLDEILVHLENILCCKQAHINYEPMIIAQESAVLQRIPTKYNTIYSVLPQKNILEMLETDDSRYIAVLSAKKGCMNSALFCEHLLNHILATYPNRFKLVEESPVSEVVLEKERALLHIRNRTVTSKKVVLCTNGFEKFTITNKAGRDIDKAFHHLVRGSVGYMAGYLEEKTRPPIAISYLPNKESSLSNEALDAEPYFYLTRRPFENDEHKNYNLVCIGGPEALMDDTNNYKKEHPFPEEAQNMIDSFLHKTYKYSPKGSIEYRYHWHGLMGYTPNGVRCIGAEPANQILLYNLGCNGVGILPSIYGSKRISQILANEFVAPSIFDPRNNTTSMLRDSMYKVFIGK
jgi:glycine/D-amino acid oxidase-like deaminating enzyme